MEKRSFRSEQEKQALIEAVESLKIEGFTFNKKELQAVKDLVDGKIQVEDVVRMVKVGELKATDQQFDNKS